MVHDCLIIGAGPAGLTAATYLARFRRSVAIVDAGLSRARWIPSTHNCPGFPFGVAGDELLGRFRAQAGAYGARIVKTRIDHLTREDGHFVGLAHGDMWRAKTVILATGMVDRLPEIEGVERAIGTGALRLCAVCDGYEAKDEVIGVYGPGRTALGHAEFLRTFSNDVAIIESDAASLDDRSLIERAQARGVRWFPFGSQLSIAESGCRVTFEGRSYHLHTVYPVLGADVQSMLGAGLGAVTSPENELIVDESSQTSVPGLYAIGDVVVGLNQISVAVGQAAIAASAIHRSLPPNPR